MFWYVVALIFPQANVAFHEPISHVQRKRQSVQDPSADVEISLHERYRSISNSDRQQVNSALDVSQVVERLSWSGIAAAFDDSP